MPTKHPALPTKTLNLSAKIWFIFFFTGQLIFAAYIILLYWRSGLTGQLEKWNLATPHLYVKGRPLGNSLFGLHIVIAAMISILGPLQLIPAIRSRAPRWHRVSGRIYIIAAFLIGIDGILLVWRKGSVGGVHGHVIISINALLILLCAFFTLRHAVRRNLRAHQQWAVHLLLAMSGVWLFRVFLMFWIILNHGPAGFDEDSFTGPALDIIGILVYIFPQLLVALYFKAKHSPDPAHRLNYAIFLSLISLSMLVGIVVATMALWLPRMF